MRILVTGGAGFVGTNLVNKLIKDGHRVTIIDNFSTGKRKNIILQHIVGNKILQQWI